MSQSVFVLEDDVDISRLVQHHLEAAGFAVRPYLTPTNLIPDAERQPPALFLLDIMVPGGDGLDVGRRMVRDGCADLYRDDRGVVKSAYQAELGSALADPKRACGGFKSPAEWRKRPG